MLFSFILLSLVYLCFIQLKGTNAAFLNAPKVGDNKPRETKMKDFSLKRNTCCFLFSFRFSNKKDLIIPKNS